MLDRTISFRSTTAYAGQVLPSCSKCFQNTVGDKDEWRKTLKMFYS